MSFSWVALRRIRRMAPDLQLVMLAHNPQEWYRARPFVENDWVAGPGKAVLRQHPDVIRRIRRSGRPVHVWTVNTTDDVDLCLELGIEALITDRPAATAAYLDKVRPRV
jgi:glycerophosphoryl diester phosphodiesterase